MAKEKSSKLAKASIVFYIASVIFLGIAAFYIYMTYDSVSSYTGTDLQLRDILNVYFSNSAPFFAYAIGCYGIGLVISKITMVSEVLSLCLQDADVEQERGVVENEEEVIFTKDALVQEESEGEEALIDTQEQES